MLWPRFRSDVLRPRRVGNERSSANRHDRIPLHEGRAYAASWLVQAVESNGNVASVVDMTLFMVSSLMDCLMVGFKDRRMQLSAGHVL